MGEKNNDRSQIEAAILEYLQSAEEEEETPPIDIRNLCSWLLNFSPEELVVITTILAIIIGNSLNTIAEKAVVGSFFTSLADTILLIAAQETLMSAARDEEKELIEQKKAQIDKEKEKIAHKAEEKEKETIQKEIQELKEKIEKLETILNQQLRL